MLWISCISEIGKFSHESHYQTFIQIVLKYIGFSILCLLYVMYNYCQKFYEYSMYTTSIIYIYIKYNKYHNISSIPIISNIKLVNSNFNSIFRNYQNHQKSLDFFWDFLYIGLLEFIKTKLSNLCVKRYSLWLDYEW